MLKKLKILKIILINSIVLINLIACNNSKTLNDDFQLWGQPICLNNQEKQTVSNKNLNYYIKHNEMLNIKTCKNIKK